MKAILRTLVGFIFPLALLGTMPSFGNDGDTLIFPDERATYVEGNSSISFRLRNATTKVPYLVQT